MYGQAIKQQRLLKNMSQLELSKATNIPQTTISWIEKDKGIPTIDYIITLAKYYEISIEELLGLDEDFPKQLFIKNYNNVKINF